MSDILEKNDMGGHVVLMGEGRGVYMVSVGKHEGNRPKRGPGLDGKIIVRQNFGKWNVGNGLN
jgi:hypothetical protein